MSIVLRRKGSESDKRLVDAIKALRNATGLGLKDSKELFDRAWMAPVTVPFDIPSTKLRLLQYDLQSTGFELLEDRVSDFAETYESTVRALASQAVLAGDDVLAERFISILRDYS
jgi:hypothetical protein